MEKKWFANKLHQRVGRFKIRNKFGSYKIIPYICPMKKIAFAVTIEFADKISDDNEILEVASNIARAIKNEVNGMGIVPEDSETYTKSISVKPIGMDEVITLQIV